MPQFGFSTLIWDQYTRLPPVLSVDLTGKSVVVAGANTGIGLEIAKHFARMGAARVILACRSEEKGKKAAEVIAKEISYSAEVQLLDLASFKSVINFVKRLEGAPIDIVVANAAVALPEHVATEDGWEQCIQVNHLSTALLSFLLVPNMLKAAELHSSISRLAIVSSEVHFLTDFSQELVQSEIIPTLSKKEFCTRAEMARRYPVTKLLNVLFTRAFAHHISPTIASVLVPSAANPGLCRTELVRNAPFLMRMRIGLMQIVMGRTAEQGARQVVWAALGPDGKEGPHVRQTMSGAYVSIAEVRQPSDFVTSKEGWDAQQKVWQETVDILSKAEPSVRVIVDQYFSA